MKRLATEQAILLACSLLCASVVRSERTGTSLEQTQQLPAGKELPLHGVNGKLALLGSTELQVQELRFDFKSRGCQWLALPGSAAQADLGRHRQEARETALQQSRQNEGEGIWHLPTGLTWSDVSRLLLRCEDEEEAMAWATISHAQDPSAWVARSSPEQQVWLRGVLGWMRSLSHHSIGQWRPTEPGIPTEGHQQGLGGSGDWAGRGGQIGQDGQRAERVLQQSSGAIGQLATYPGQTGVGGQGAAQIQAGNPRPLFPTDLTTPPTKPASQQLLQVSNNVDAGQQQPPRPPLQSVDSSSSFSALDVASSPPAITSPTVTVASDTPSTPALGAYPDSLINTPAAFPGESPSATTVGATGTIASPPPAATSVVPLDTLNGADFGEAAAPVLAPAPQPPVQAPAPVPAPTPAPTQTPSPTPKATQTPAATGRRAPAAAPVHPPGPAPAQAAQQEPAATVALVPAPVQAPVPAPQVVAPMVAPVQAPTPALSAAPVSPPQAAMVLVSPPAQAPALAGLPGIRIPVTMLSGPPITAPVTAPALALQPQAAAPGPAAQAAGPFPSAAMAPAPAQNISALLNALSPADRSVVANQSLSSLAGAVGQNLSSVNGENLSPYSNTTAGTLLGSIIATGNPLAPVPAPEVQPLLAAVGAEGTPPAGAISAAVPSSNLPDEAGIRRTPRLPVHGSSEYLAPAPSTVGGASSAETAALQAAGAPTQSADAALAAAAAAAQQSDAPSPASARAPAKGPVAAPAYGPGGAQGAAQAPAPGPAGPEAAPSFAPALAPGSLTAAQAAQIAQDAAESQAQAPATQANYESDSQLAEAAIAASLALTGSPQAAPAPAPDRGALVSSASLPSAPAPAPEAFAAPNQLPPPQNNVTLSYQPPSGLSVGGYPMGGPPSTAAPVQAPAAGPASAAPAPAPAPLQATAPTPGPGAAAAVAAAPAGGKAPAAAPNRAPAQAPAPAQAANIPVINLSLNLAGAGLSNLTTQNAVSIKGALADQLHIYPSQIQIISNSTTRGPPHRHLLQQQGTGGTEGANLQIQIMPTPDQRQSVLDTLQDPSFNSNLQQSLAAEGLQVDSASVAAVSQSGGPSPPAVAAPAASEGRELARSNAILVKVHGWLMFAGLVVLMPAGILIANLFSRTHARNPWWFYAHATLTGSGALAGVVGFVIGLMLMIPSRYALIHRWIGISIIISITFQMVLSFLLRPAPEHWLRRPWNLVHWWWGRLIAVAALGNFFFGLWMLNSSLVWYIVPAAIIAAFLIASALKAMIDYLIVPAGGVLPVGGKVQEFQSPMRTDFHLPGLGGSNGGARKGLHDLYSPKPGVGGLRTRPSYLGSGSEIQLAQAQSPSTVAASPAVNGGGSFTAGRLRPFNGRGDSPPRSGGFVPQSAFYSQAQELRKDASLESKDSMEGPSGETALPEAGRGGPRQPLRPLPSRPSLGDRLPPRPSELLKEGKLGAGEAIMARRRNRRLVPDGALSSRLTGSLGTRVSGGGHLDEGNPMAKRAENFRPRPRPSRITQTPSPARSAGSPSRAARPGSASPEEIFGTPATSPERLRTPPRANGVAHSSSPPSDGNSVDENEMPPGNSRVPPLQIPPAAQARMASYGR